MKLYSLLFFIDIFGSIIKIIKNQKIINLQFLNKLNCQIINFISLSDKLFSFGFRDFNTF